MAQWTARICWIFCFGVVSCSLFALKLLTTQFCCMQREGNAPVSTRQGVGFLKCARVLGQTLHTTDTKMGIWEVSYFLICTWSTSLWCPWGCEFPVFFVELLQVLRAYSGSVKEWLQTSEQELQPLLPFLWSLQTHRQSVTSLRVTYKVRADRIQLQAGVKPAIICFAGAAVLGCRAKSFHQQDFGCSLLLLFSCSVWVVWDALIPAARIYLSVREAGSTFVECLPSDVEELERFFILSFVEFLAAFYRESWKESFLNKTPILRLPSPLCPGFSEDRASFFSVAVTSAVFWIPNENDVDSTVIFWGLWLS